MPTTVPDYVIENNVTPVSADINRKSKDTSRGINERPLPLFLRGKVKNEHLADVAGILERRRLPFRCDAPAEDLGNCFPYALMQQLRRPKVRSTLSAELAIFSENCHALRIAVVEFVQNINPLSDYFKPIHQAILEYSFAIGGSWEDRLEEMSRDGIWFDDQLMQFTSWFLKMDIFCHTRSFTKSFNIT